MTDETLSALFDGECSAAELDEILDRIDKDPSLADRYTRMVLARASRGASFRRHDVRFAARVMAALESEEQGEAPVVVPFVARQPRLERYWRPAAGLAMAAGLGAVAVLALQTGEAPTATPAIVAAVESAAPRATATEVAERSWDQLGPADAERLNAYLIAYGQSRAQQGMGSTLGTARFAAHTAEYRPQRIQGPTAHASTTRDRQP